MSHAPTTGPPHEAATQTETLPAPPADEKLPEVQVAGTPAPDSAPASLQVSVPPPESAQEGCSVTALSVDMAPGGVHLDRGQLPLYTSQMPPYYPPSFISGQSRFTAPEPLPYMVEPPPPYSPGAHHVNMHFALPTQHTGQWPLEHHGGNGQLNTRTGQWPLEHHGGNGQLNTHTSNTGSPGKHENTWRAGATFLFICILLVIMFVFIFS